MRDWHDVLPRGVAIRQNAWDRVRQIGRMRDLGMTEKMIGARLGISQGRVHQLLLKRNGYSPIEQYFKDDSDLREIAYLAREDQRRSRYMTS
jgi:predicted transcriptional regulator